MTEPEHIDWSAQNNLEDTVEEPKEADFTSSNDENANSPNGQLASLGGGVEKSNDWLSMTLENTVFSGLLSMLERCVMGDMSDV